MSRAALLAYDVAVVVFCAVGAAGVVAGAWELTWLFPQDLSSLGDRPSFESQQHFFKALELGMGLMLGAVRPVAFTVPRVRAAVVAVMWLPPLARVAAWIGDGPPSAAFVALLGIELAGALVITAHALDRGRATVAAARA